MTKTPAATPATLDPAAAGASVLRFSRYGARYVFTFFMIAYFWFSGVAPKAPFSSTGVVVAFGAFVLYVFGLQLLHGRIPAAWLPKLTLAPETALIALGLSHDPIHNMALLPMVPLLQIEYGLRNNRTEYRRAVVASTAALIAALALRRWLLGDLPLDIWASMTPLAMMAYYTWIVMTQRDLISSKALEARQRMEMAVKTAGIGIWVSDVRAQTVTLDDVAHRQIGLAAGMSRTVDYRRFLELMSKAEARRVEAALAEAIRERRDVEVEYELLWPDRSLHIIRTHAHVQQDDEGRVQRVIGISMDVTHTRRQATENANITRRMLMAQELTGFGTWHINLQNQEIRFDEIVRRVTGAQTAERPYRLEEMMAQIHADDRERVSEVLQSALRSKQGYVVEYRIVRADGSVRHVRSHGVPKADAISGEVHSLSGVMVEITAQRKDQDRLLALSERALSQADALRIGRLRYRPRSGQLEVDGEFRKLAGLGERAAVDTLTGLMTRLAPEDREKLPLAIEEAVKLGGEFRWSWRLINARGETQDMLWIGHIERSGNGEAEVIAAVTSIARLTLASQSWSAAPRAAA